MNHFPISCFEIKRQRGHLIEITWLKATSKRKELFIVKSKGQTKTI